MTGRSRVVTQVPWEQGFSPLDFLSGGGHVLSPTKAHATRNTSRIAAGRDWG